MADTQPTDLVRLDEDKKKFDIRCRQCGSTECEFENAIAYHDSCVMGALELICRKCGASEAIFTPPFTG